MVPSIEQYSLIVEGIPSLFMLLYVTLHHLNTYTKAIPLTSKQWHLLKQKDLVEFGTLQLAVGAVVAYMTRNEYPFWFLICLIIAWIVLPYFAVTLIGKNRFGWVKITKWCFVYVGAMFAISAGVRFIADALNYNLPLVIIVMLIFAAFIFTFEYRR